MAYQFTVSPDFGPSHIAGWQIFNTWLQRQLSEGIHFELYDSFEQQRQAILENKVDFIYANPYDAAMLVRDKGFIAIAKPKEKSDEAMIVVNAESDIHSVEDLQSGTKVATTDDPDVHVMGMIMLEPADLNAENTEITQCDSYVLVAKQLLRSQCEVGFFLEEAYHDMSGMVREQMRVLVTSEIQIIQHVLLVGPELASRKDELVQMLESMSNDEKGLGVLDSLGIKGWEHLEHEDVEFMIDLMSTLVE
ncbi:MAG: PhnD/SsuA/transferrin family substrate-binding protein [Methylococcaceae bacterium]|nr:PhnD/SsuA/transferrin family substrate-binding protein [Methylococcaceae bacterium]